MAIGVDIEDISRFDNKSTEFLNRIYTKGEQEYCLSKPSPSSHLAVRFCAKEAVIKALSDLNIKTPDLNQIEIYHTENKVPKVKLLNETDTNLKIQLSLSHDKTKAVAFVTIERQ